MTNYRFSLERANVKHICPGCTQKTFKRFIDKVTGQYIDDKVGLCDRIKECTYKLGPAEFFKSNPSKRPPAGSSRNFPQRLVDTPKPEPSAIDSDLFRSCLKGYNKNPFVIGLVNLFSLEAANRVIKDYRLGTAKMFEWSVIFFQITIDGVIRTGKIMSYNPHTLKRDKNKINWVHKQIGHEGYVLQQCFFGEHLLRIYPNKPVAIVESEKTACIASLEFPQFVWLATGGVGNLSAEKFTVLKGRTVFLFPDLDLYEKWNARLPLLRSIAPKTEIVDFLKIHADQAEINAGFDLADYIIHYTRLRNIRNNNICDDRATPPTLSTPATHSVQSSHQLIDSQTSTPQLLHAEVDIKALEFICYTIGGTESISFQLMCEELTSEKKATVLANQKTELEKDNIDDIDFENLPNIKLFMYSYGWDYFRFPKMCHTGCIAIGLSSFLPSWQREKISSRINQIFRLPNVILASDALCCNFCIIVYVEPITTFKDQEKFLLYTRYLSHILKVPQEYFEEFMGISYAFCPGLLVNYDNGSILNWESLELLLKEELNSGRSLNRPD